MKVGFAVLALLVVAASASGDSNTYNYQGSGPYFNPKSGQIVDATGNAKVVDAFPNRDQNFTFSNIINNSSLAAGAGDSSAILDTHQMRVGMLLIKCTGITGLSGVDTTGAKTIRLAVQVRTHLDGGSDSLSTFVVYPYGSTGMGVTAGASPDSSVTGHLAGGGLGTTANIPWSGEQVVQFMATRQARNNGQVVSRQVWYYPNGIAIPLSSFFGRDFYSPYTSVRVVNLTAPTVKVSVSLVGSPL